MRRIAVGAGLIVAGAALAACATNLFSYKDPRPGAPVCQAAAWAASQPLPTGGCLRLGWDIDPDFAETPDDAWRLLCEAEPANAALAQGFCDRAVRVSVTDRRQELAQLLACGRGSRVMVEDLWRFGEETYQGAETLSLGGRPLRARWRGGVPFVGWTYQEILLEPASTPDGQGCGFKSDDLPGERIRERVEQ